MRRLLASAVLCACGRLDFTAQPVDAARTDAIRDGALDACAAMGDLYCDDFDRTVPIVNNDPVWLNEDCNAGGTITISGGTLDVTYPSFDGNGTEGCQLVSLPGPTARALQVDFDVTAMPDPAAGQIGIVDFGIDLGTPNAAGIQSEAFQLAIDGTGRGTLACVDYYPDAAMSPNGMHYPGYDVGDSAGLVWLIPGAACHVTVAVDADTGVQSATGTCGASIVPLTRRTPGNPAGPRGPVYIRLGYANAGTVTGAGSMRYDNLVFAAR